MATNVVMPKWGLSMQKGRITQWLKREGDVVQEGEELVEIESDKITNVVEAPTNGVLARIVLPAGEEAPITDLIAIITAAGEPIPDAPTAGSPASAAPVAPSSDASAPAQNQAPHHGKMIRAMPVARKLAEEQGIDLATVQGTGPNGAITKADVEKALAAHAAAISARSVAATAPSENPTVRAMPAARRVAKERGIDLTTVRGSGPNGAITAEDVERVAAARTARPPQSLQKVAFYSEGHRLDGLLYTPPGLPAGAKRPGVVLCVGFTYLKTLVMPDVAKALNKAGYVALVFDYRGFGDSDGPRYRLIPHEQVNDVRAAVTFLADVPHVDSNQLAVVGLSMGGSHALSAAAVDQRIRAVVALEAPGDGARWLRSLRRHYEWQEFVARIVADRAQRVRTGHSTRVDPLEIMTPDPDSRSFLNAVYAEFPQMRCDLPLETADALLEYSPQAVVGQIAPRPLLLIHGPDDRLVPLYEAEMLYAHASNPKRLLVIPEMGHFNWVMPNHPIFQKVAGALIDFLQEALPVGNI
jgi:hypothetical protein